MNSFIALLKVQLLSLFNINKAIHSKNEKIKTSLTYFLLISSFSTIILFLISFLYNGIFAYYFKKIDIEYHLAVVSSVASIVSFFTTLYKVNGLVYCCQDYDFLMSSPINHSKIIISRIITIYTKNLLITSIIMIPGAIVYGIYANASFWFYLLFILLMIIIPLVPISLSLIVGTLITWFSIHFRYKNIIYVMLTFAFLIFLTTMTFNMYNSGIKDISLIAIKMINRFYLIYPLILFFTEGLSSLDMISILLFISISIAFFLFTTFIIGVNYKKINSTINKKSFINNFKIGKLKESNIVLALYKKEIRRFFSSPFYVVNTLIPMVFLLLFTFALGLYNINEISFIVDIEGVGNIIKELLPIIISFFVVLCCSTVSSISVEGKSLWILKSLPVKTKTILFIKIAVNLTITIPVIIVSCYIFLFGKKYDFLEKIIFYLTPILFSVFISFLGIIINLKFPVLDWKNEEAAIKQSSGSTILIIIGIGSIMLSLSLLIILMKFVKIALLGINLILIIIICSFYIYLKRNGEKLFIELDK